MQIISQKVQLLALLSIHCSSRMTSAAKLCSSFVKPSTIILRLDIPCVAMREISNIDIFLYNKLKLPSACMAIAVCSH